MCHGFECFSTTEVIAALISDWTVEAPYIVGSINSELLIKDMGLANIVSPQGLARFVVIETKREGFLRERLDRLMREVRHYPTGLAYMNEALFAEGIITPADIGLPADAFAPTAQPMPLVKVDAEMIELEKRAEAEAREVQAEVKLAEKKKRALQAALTSVKV